MNCVGNRQSKEHWKNQSCASLPSIGIQGSYLVAVVAIVVFVSWKAIDPQSIWFMLWTHHRPHNMGLRMWDGMLMYDFKLIWHICQMRFEFILGVACWSDPRTLRMLLKVWADTNEEKADWGMLGHNCGEWEKWPTIR